MCVMFNRFVSVANASIHFKPSVLKDIENALAGNSQEITCPIVDNKTRRHPMLKIMTSHSANPEKNLQNMLIRITHTFIIIINMCCAIRIDKRIAHTHFAWLPGHSKKTLWFILSSIHRRHKKHLRFKLESQHSATFSCCQNRE